MADFSNDADPNALVWNRFTRYMESSRLSPRTIQSYTEAAQKLAGHAKNADLLTLDRGDIEAFLIELARLHRDTTAQNRYRSLRAFYNWCEREEYIEWSPMARMKVPKADEVLIPMPATSDLRAVLLACSGKDFDSVRDNAMFRLMADCGLRLAETAGLTLADIDLVTDHVTVNGKNSRWRKAAFIDATGKAITKYVRLRKSHSLAHLAGLWLGARGQPLTSSGVTQALRRRCRKAGIQPPIRPHQLRRWSIGEHLHDGLSSEDAIERYGWTSPAMLRVYARDTGSGAACWPRSATAA